MNTVIFFLFPFVIPSVICQSIPTIIDDVKQENEKTTQIIWPYSNLPSTKAWYKLKEPASGYPASTWPLSATNARAAQRYDGINFAGSDTKVPLREADTHTSNEELGDDDVKPI